MFLQHFFQFGRVYISFKRDLQLCLFGFVYCTVQCDCLSAFDMSFGSIKMGISRHNISFMYQIRE